MIDWRAVAVGMVWAVAPGLVGLATIAAGVMLDRAPIAVIGGVLFGWTLASLRRWNG